MNELARTKRALEVAMKAIAELEGADNRAFTGPRAHRAICDVYNMLNPPLEMEDVEVVRYKLVYDDGKLSGCRDFGSVDAVHQFCPDATGGNIVKLTGTYQRPKPQTVERSVNIEISLMGLAIPASAKDGGYCGRTGTFTWTEQLTPAQ